MSVLESGRGANTECPRSVTEVIFEWGDQSGLATRNDRRQARITAGDSMPGTLQANGTVAAAIATPMYMPSIQGYRQ